MNSKDCRRQRTGPKIAGEISKGEKQKDSRCGME
jgi:hypothetical protein